MTTQDEDEVKESANALGVRVLLPDGGQMEEPEEREEEQTDAESEVAEEAEDEESESESEDAEESSEGADEEAADEDEGEDEDEKEDTEAEADEDEEADTEADEDADQESTEREEAVSEEGSRILHLNVDGVFLDLLGLEVDLETVTLDVTAIPGDSKLLGNLLSAVSGALGGSPLGNLLGSGDEEGSGLLPSMPELPALSPIERAKELAKRIAGRIRDAVENTASSILGALPLEELFSKFLREVVEQLLEPSNGNGGGAEEPASA